MPADASTDSIERMVLFLLGSPPIAILPVNNYLKQNKRLSRPPRYDCEAILELLRDGTSVRNTACAAGCSPLTVYKVLNAHNAANPSDEIELAPNKLGRPRGF